MTTAKSNFSPWPYAIISSFVLLAIFDAFIISAAYRTKTGVIEDSPYQAGLNYDKVIQAKDAAKAANLKLNFSYAAQTASFEINGLLSAGQKNLRVKLLRPSNINLDKSLEIKSDNNIFIVSDLNLQPGLWILQASLLINDLEYYFEERVVV